MNAIPGPGSPGWNTHMAEGNAHQARKRVASDALLLDVDGRVLLVDPTYKPDWDLPGGMAEANETPVDAVRRELAEELGLDIRFNDLLCVDWVAPHGPWDDLIAFVFDAGTLSPDACARLRPHDDEIAACAFFEPTQGLELLGERQRRRLAHALDAVRDRVPRYLHDGNPPW
ncbi:NUDIX hydrolase (plasmid) [Embleya sp. NBC_00888]|uniref:NUDIX hydrolase n=1 Tax=Embleya sp. NBC_00888 TaxID=2975960 RepID=UPI002F90927B|nr:NUDIX hydrolase [Embleya sp. NBC_00888]